MKNACASASTGWRADRMESCLMERSCTTSIIRIIFSIIRIICLGCTGMWARALQVRRTHCISMPVHTHSACNNEPMEHRGSCRCCRKRPNCYDYTRLFYIISRFLRLVFHYSAAGRRLWSFRCITCDRMVCSSVAPVLCFCFDGLTDTGSKSFDCDLVLTLETYDDPEHGNYSNYTCIAKFAIMCNYAHYGNYAYHSHYFIYL
jgi:hypothetical protein